MRAVIRNVINYSEAAIWVKWSKCEMLIENLENKKIGIEE